MNEQSIKLFSDENLLSSLSGLFENERKTSRLIVLHLSEIESRGLYAKRGFDSLHRMLVENFKLSESSAYRRLQAMRLIKDVPDVQASLVAGELNLTTISMVQTQIQREEKLTGEKICTERKAEIVRSIKNKTQRDAEIELYRQLPETATNPRNQERRISETETRLSQNFPDRVLNKLKRLREIWSHVDPNMDYVEVIERCADEILKRIDPTQKKVTTQRFAKLKKQNVKMKPTGYLDKPLTAMTKRPTYYSTAVKHEIYSRAESCCESVDPKTGKRCRARFLLQIDHRIPLWAGGTNDSTNLQLLCSTHNRLKYAVETKPTSLSDQVVLYRRRECFGAIVGF